MSTKSAVEQTYTLATWVEMVWNEECWDGQEKADTLSGMIMGIQGITHPHNAIHKELIEELELLKELALY